MAINHELREATSAILADGRYGYIAPTYKEAKRIAWDYWQRFAGPIPDVHFDQSELRVDLPNGAKVFLLGAEDPDSLRGPYWDGMVFDEYAHVHPRAWPEIVRPALTSRKGWALFLGTPFGRNQFFELYERARRSSEFLTRLYRASESGVIPQEELTLARREMTDEQYAQEFECSFEAAIQGAYYAKELDEARASGRIRGVAWEPAVPVDTYWDLGIGAPTAIIFAQKMGREIHLIDYVEARDQALSGHVKALRDRPYLYGMHHLPHDAGQRELGAGMDIAEQLKALGLKPCTIHGANDPEDGINQTRLVFSRFWFDERKCAVLLNVLANYRADWDDKKRTFKELPRHDWASHGADALRVLAVSLRLKDSLWMPTQIKRSKTAFSPFTYDRQP